MRIFISKLSGQLAQPVSEQKEKVYTVEELAEKMKVTAKTIYRWRKRGLIAEKFIFGKGTRRLGFLQSSVEHFLGQNPELTGKAGRFERLTDKHKSRIVKMAAKFRATTDMSDYRIIKKISAEMGKCNETIRYTLLDYDRANPEKAVLKKSAGVIEPSQAAEIYKLYKQGYNITELMERFDRNKSSIYRTYRRSGA